MSLTLFIDLKLQYLWNSRSQHNNKFCFLKCVMKLFKCILYKSSEPIKFQCWPHIETSRLICRANQLTGFYMRATLAFNGLIDLDFVLLFGQSSKKMHFFRQFKGIVNRAEPCKCDILLLSRILWCKRINPSLKEWRFLCIYSCLSNNKKLRTWSV